MPEIIVITGARGERGCSHQTGSTRLCALCGARLCPSCQRPTLTEAVCCRYGCARPELEALKRRGEQLVLKVRASIASNGSHILVDSLESYVESVEELVNARYAQER